MTDRPQAVCDNELAIYIVETDTGELLRGTNSYLNKEKDLTIPIHNMEWAH